MTQLQGCVRNFVLLVLFSALMGISGAQAWPSSPEYPTYSNKAQCLEAVFKRYDAQVEDIALYGDDTAKPLLLEAARAVHGGEKNACNKTYAS